MGESRQVEHIYKNFVMDSSRWSRFTPRNGDVLVCTSYKAGTTWTQMICALLIHQTADLPRPLAELSPWWDMVTAPIDEVVSNYEAQSHRRFIKTHTPLDALPWFDNVTYLYCGRDPRDVFMSMQHHMGNLNFMQFAKVMTEQGVTIEPPPPMPEDLNARFEMWMTQGSYDWEQDGFPHWSHFRHGKSFWDQRDRPNIHFLHYADLKADLEGEMRRIARVLGVEIPEARWPDLVKAATFEDMKSNADRRAPDSNHDIWISNSEFFHKGENAQWRGALSAASLDLYEKLKTERYPAPFRDWLEKGTAAVGDPKTL